MGTLLGVVFRVVRQGRSETALKIPLGPFLAPFGINLESIGSMLAPLGINLGSMLGSAAALRLLLLLF